MDKIKLKGFRVKNGSNDYSDLLYSFGPLNILDATNLGSLKTIGANELDNNYHLGNHAFALGYETLASGNYSHAEGHGSSSKGLSSHALGVNSIAYNIGTHAEGSSTAYGNYSHAEGENTVSGHISGSSIGAHAEGRNTSAQGNASHALGYGTLTDAVGAHALGYNTRASGDYSHAQNIGTIAASDYQTVLGRYNIEDNDNTYAIIIGNGTSNDSRSNAFVMDWDGTARVKRYFSEASSWIIHTGYNKGDDDLTSENYRGIQFYEDGTTKTNVGNAHLTGRVYNTIVSSGDVATIIAASKPEIGSTSEATMSIWYPLSGSPYIRLGAETRVIGNLHLSGGNKDIAIHNSVTKGTNPLSNTTPYAQFIIQDNSDLTSIALSNRLGAFRQYTLDSGTNVVAITSYKNEEDSVEQASLGVYYPLQGNPYISSGIHCIHFNNADDDNSYLAIHSGVTKGVKPQKNYLNQIIFQDATSSSSGLSNRLGIIRQSINSNELNYVGIRAYKPLTNSTASVGLGIYYPKDSSPYILADANLRIDGMITSGNKVNVEDGTAGVVIGASGSIYLTHATGDGSSINFLYGNSPNPSTSTTAYIKEISSGTLKIYNNVIINNNLTVNGSSSIGGSQHVTGSVSTGSKTISNDGKVGGMLSSGGNLFLQNASGSTIYFYYGNNTENPAYIQESSQNTLKLYNNVIVNNNLTVNATATAAFFKSSGSIGTNNKTSGSDTVTGAFLTSTGNLHLTHETAGSSIYFYWNNKSTITSQITESSEGTIKVVGEFISSKMIASGGKTAWNDNHSGVYLGTSGTMYLAHDAGGGSYINFMYGKNNAIGTAVTAYIQEVTEGTLKLYNNVIVNNSLTVNGASSIGGSQYTTGSVCTGLKAISNDGKVGGMLSSGGNLYLQSTTGSAINFYYSNNTNRTAYILESSLGTLKLYNNVIVNGALMTGNKTSYNDGVDGVYLGLSGSIYLTHAAGDGSSVNFMYGGGTSTTAYIKETSSSTLKLSNNVIVNNELTTGGSIFASTSGNDTLYIQAKHGSGQNIRINLFASSTQIGLNGYVGSAATGSTTPILIKNQNGKITLGDAVNTVLTYSSHNGPGTPIISPDDSGRISQMKVISNGNAIKVTAQYGTNTAYSEDIYIPFTSSNTFNFQNFITTVETRLTNLLNR